MSNMKNLYKKTRDKELPYEIWKGVALDGWEWRVLKKYQSDDTKPFARWFCFVKSPFAEEYGDVYVQEIKDNAVQVFVDETVK